MKKIALVFLLCAASMFSGYSQTKQESIKELFHLMRQDSLMDKMFSSMIPAMVKQMQSQMPVKDSTAMARSNEMLSAVMQTVKEISKRMIDEDAAQMYAKYFEEKEILDLITFYKSTTGQKLISVTPDIQKELMTVMMSKYIPEIQKTIKEKAEEMKKAYQNDIKKE